MIGIYQSGCGNSWVSSWPFGVLLHSGNQMRKKTMLPMISVYYLLIPRAIFFSHTTRIRDPHGKTTRATPFKVPPSSSRRWICRGTRTHGKCGKMGQMMMMMMIKLWSNMFVLFCRSLADRGTLLHRHLGPMCLSSSTKWGGKISAFRAAAKRERR